MSEEQKEDSKKSLDNKKESSNGLIKGLIILAIVMAAITITNRLISNHLWKESMPGLERYIEKNMEDHGTPYSIIPSDSVH